ncbi:MAG: ATPase domain-containing protein [Methanomassiliicoccales archaeon]
MRLLKNSFQGLDKVLRSEVDLPKVVLVMGPPGSMKTSFCFSVMTRHAQSTGEIGMYLTLEESTESHLKNMKSVGISSPASIYIADFTDLRELENVGEEDDADYIRLIEKMVSNFRQRHGKDFTMLTIDSLGALYSLLPEHLSVRKSMYHFFKFLRDLNLFTMLILEGSLSDGRFYAGSEAFLSDGVIYLGMDNTKGKISRYIQVEKMRACDHSMERYALEVGRGGMQILGPLLGN